MFHLSSVQTILFTDSCAPDTIELYLFSLLVSELVISVKSHVSCNLGNLCSEKTCATCSFGQYLFARVPGSLETLELPNIKEERESAASTLS